MANDRVHIKCSACGGWKMLLSYFPGQGALHSDNDILPWLDSHAHCCGRGFTSDLGDDPGFSLHTENDELDMNKQNLEGDSRKER